MNKSGFILYNIYKFNALDIGGGLSMLTWKVGNTRDRSQASSRDMPKQSFTLTHTPIPNHLLT